MQRCVMHAKANGWPSSTWSGVRTSCPCASSRGSGSLSAHRRELLAERGLDIEEEDARAFAEGLSEFEQHLKENHGRSYVPPAHFTPSGFPLSAWATKQRAGRSVLGLGTFASGG